MEDVRLLRLLVTEECDRSCEGCCNKEWDLSKLAVCDDFSGYDMVMLTGGEPLLHLSDIAVAWHRIREQNKCPIYVYTAMAKDPHIFRCVLELVDGITLTLHEHTDVLDFLRLQQEMTHWDIYGKSMRLNVFKGLNVPGIEGFWTVKENIEWIKNCPLPHNESFMRLNDVEESE